MKITFHERNPLDFPYDVAAEIVLSLGGDMELIAKRVAGSFDYIFHFIQLKDKSQKRLKGIYEITYIRDTAKIKIMPICLYEYSKDSWKWFYELSKDKETAAKEEDEESFYRYKSLLMNLAGYEKSKEV